MNKWRSLIANIISAYRRFIDLEEHSRVQNFQHLLRRLPHGRRRRHIQPVQQQAQQIPGEKFRGFVDI